MTNKTKTAIGILALIAATTYVAMPFDVDHNWYGYIDDFFVFMAGYTFFMATRSRSVRAGQLLRVIAGALFIIGMLSLIALIIFC